MFRMQRSKWRNLLGDDSNVEQIIVLLEDLIIHNVLEIECQTKSDFVTLFLLRLIREASGVTMRVARKCIAFG